MGTSYSAEDVGSQCWKYGAKSITSTYRRAPMGFNWPANWEEKPGLVRVDENTAYFGDGTSKKIDAIILCTGYKHHFPFLPDDLRLKTANRLASADLYKGVAWVHNPRLFYLGMQDQWFTFNMFDAQAWWVRDAIMGRIAIPDDKAVLLKDVADRVAGEDAGKDAHDAFYAWKDHKKYNVMTFRDNSYKSVITGTMAPAHHTPWKDDLEDSMESYLRN